jgi:hypothetical protein
MAATRSNAPSAKGSARPSPRTKRASGRRRAAMASMAALWSSPVTWPGSQRVA